MSEQEKIQLIVRLVSAVTKSTKAQGCNESANRAEIAAIQKVARELIQRRLTDEEIEQMY